MSKNLSPLFILTLLLLLGSLVGNARFLFSGRASERGSTGLSFSVENYYLSISPTEANPTGNDRIRLTLYLLSSEGRGVPAKTVAINKPIELTIEAVQPQTDINGRAVFDFMASKAGEYYIEATVDGKKVGEGIKLNYR